MRGQLVSDNPHVLIVDDDVEICTIVKEYLSQERYPVSVAHNGSEMRRIVQRSAVDIALLDLMLPQENGLTLARSLHTENPDIGIIMVTGRGETVDRIIGLEMGADDYLVKPFHLRELLARIKSVRRRAVPLVTSQTAGGSSQFRFAGWLLDASARELYAPAGRRVRLTTGEFDLLAAFVNHPNQLLSRDHLLDLARHRESGPFDRTIDVQVGRLRRKLDDDPKQPHLIKTLRGAGYIFAVPVEA